MRDGPVRIRQAALGVLLLAAAWAAWNGTAYALGAAARHRAESAWFIFAAVFLVFGALTTFSSGEIAPRVPRATVTPIAWPSTRVCLLLVASAFVLYAPILGIGLLSDDFVLLERARQGAFLEPGWDYVRPLPMALWITLDRLVPPSLLPVALHALNVALHGVNAWLVYRLAASMTLPPPSAALAALLFLCAPLSVEPVAWASGIFDVFLTFCVLACATAILSPPTRSFTRWLWVLTTGAAALASKETAVALPLLMAILIPWAAPPVRRHAIRSALGLLVLVAMYGLWRWSRGMPESHTALPSGYALKELVSRPFGALGLGLHARVLSALPLLAPVIATAWPLLLVRSAVSWPARHTGFLLLSTGALWVLLSALPVSTLFFVGPDLQGARYLYLGTAMWSIALMGSIFTAHTDRWRTALRVATIVVLAGSVLALRAHLEPWREAGRRRDSVLSEWAKLDSPCVPSTIANLPDQVAGAYVFRNGFPEATRIGGTDTPDKETPCAIEWTPSGFIRVQ